MASQLSGNLLESIQGGELNGTTERASSDERRTIMDNADAAAAAVRAAKSLNASLLTADREREHASLKAEYESLMASFTKQQGVLSESREKISELQRQIINLDEEVVSQKENAVREGRRSKNWEEKDKDNQERLARVEVEADSLRQEVR